MHNHTDEDPAPTTLFGEDLPAHVHAEVCSNRHPYGETLYLVVVWADRAADRCPRCHEHVGTEPKRPAMCGQFGDAEAFDQQHGCGEWLSPPWTSVSIDGDVPDDAEAAKIAAAVTEMAEEYAASVTEENSRRRNDAIQRLRARVAEYDELIADGEDPEETRDRLSSGEWEDYGVAWMNDRWEAWAPYAGEEGGDPMIVPEEDGTRES